MDDLKERLRAGSITPEATHTMTEAADRIEALEAKLAVAREVLGNLIEHCHEQERQLTEYLYSMDYCGESKPLTDARRALRNSTMPRPTTDMTPRFTEADLRAAHKAGWKAGRKCAPTFRGGYHRSFWDLSNIRADLGLGPNANPS